MKIYETEDSGNRDIFSEYQDKVIIIYVAE